MLNTVHLKLVKKHVCQAMPHFKSLFYDPRYHSCMSHIAFLENKIFLPFPFSLCFIPSISASLCKMINNFNEKCLAKILCIIITVIIIDLLFYSCQSAVPFTTHLLFARSLIEINTPTQTMNLPKRVFYFANILAMLLKIYKFSKRKWNVVGR